MTVSIISTEVMTVSIISTEVMAISIIYTDECFYTDDFLSTELPILLQPLFL